MSGHGRHRPGGRGADPPPDPQQRPVLLHYAASGWTARRRWSERLVLAAGALAVLGAISIVTLTGAWAGFALLGGPTEPARRAADAPATGTAAPRHPPSTSPAGPSEDAGAAPRRGTTPGADRWADPSLAAQSASAPSEAAPQSAAPRTSTPPQGRPDPSAPPQTAGPTEAAVAPQTAAPTPEAGDVGTTGSPAGTPSADAPPPQPAPAPGPAPAPAPEPAPAPTTPTAPAAPSSSPSSRSDADRHPRDHHRHEDEGEKHEHEKDEDDGDKGGSGPHEECLEQSLAVPTT
jgi:hypothetical protein